MAIESMKRYWAGDGIILGEVQWSAVFAGAIVTVIGQLLLNLLGVGVGVGLGPVTPENQVEVASVALFWWGVSALTSSFAGGWTAGWVAGASPRTDEVEGALQGFLGWAVATIFIGVLVLGLAGGSVVAARLGGPMMLDPAGTTETAQAASLGALAAFITLLISALAAMGAGWFGVDHAAKIAGAATTGQANIRQQASVAAP